MTDRIGVSVELFGTARMACGRRCLDMRLPANAGLGDVCAAAAVLCPDLVGVALRDDLRGLLASYTLNINAREFVSESALTLRDGDRLLLFSSQAGG